MVKFVGLCIKVYFVKTNPMGIADWVWATAWVGELGWAVRPWQLGLVRGYPFLTSCVIFAAVHSAASFAACHAFGSPRCSVSDNQVYARSNPLQRKGPGRLFAFTRAGEERPDEERCIRHRYGFDEDSIPFNESIPPYPFRFLFLVRGEPRKGAHYLLEAWQQAELGKKAELCFAGSFEEAYLKYLLEHYDNEGVRYLGFVSGDRE